MDWFRKKKKNLYEPYLVEHKNPDGSVEHYNPTYLVPKEDGRLDWSDGYKDLMRDQAISLASATGTNYLGNWMMPSGTPYFPYDVSINYEHLDTDRVRGASILTCVNCGTRYLFDTSKISSVLVALTCQQCGGRL